MVPGHRLRWDRMWERREETRVLQAPLLQSLVFQKGAEQVACRRAQMA